MLFYDEGEKNENLLILMLVGEIFIYDDGARGELHLIVEKSI